MFTLSYERIYVLIMCLKCCNTHYQTSICLAKKKKRSYV